MNSGFDKRIDLESQPTAPAENRFVNLFSVATLIASILISSSFILRDSGVVPAPPMDQHFVETINLHISYAQNIWKFQYPSLQNSGGITSSLIAGIYKLIIPTTHENLNWHIRIFAMASFLTSSFFLFNTFIANQFVRILAFVIIATSGFQLLQPSSDLFSATLLNLSFVAASLRWPRIWTALFLAGFGLCKVDMILAALALALGWWLWERQQNRPHPERGLIFTILWLGIFLMPGFVVHEANPFSGSRSLIAFMSAYVEFFGYHQFHKLELSELDTLIESVRLNMFGGANSFIEIVTRYPTLYFDFVGVSGARSFPNLINVFKFMLIPIAVVYFRHKEIKAHRLLLWGALIAAICIILPTWLVIYMRIRYAVKIAAPLIAIALAGCLELGHYNRRYTVLIWACGIASILWQLYYFNDMAIYSHFK
jgi:hypothetical protein